MSVIVEHRLRQVQPHVNRVLVMREGLIVDDTGGDGADAGCGLAGAALCEWRQVMRTMTMSTGVARILIVGDSPAFGKTVGASYWDMTVGEPLPRACLQVLAGRVGGEDFSGIKRVLAGYLEKPERHGDG